MDPDAPPDFAEVEAWIEAVLDDFPPGAEPARQRAQDLLAAVLTLYGEAMRRAAELAQAVDASAIRDRWEQDAILSELLAIHDAAGPTTVPADMAAARKAGSTMEAIIEDLSKAEADIRGRTEALLGAVIDLHGVGLTRLIRATTEESSVAADLRRRLGRDDLVASLLISHGVHPEPLEKRLTRVLDDLTAHSGPMAAVELDDVSDGHIRLRVSGDAPADAWRFRLSVERAIDERLPDAASVTITGGDEPVQPTSVVIPLDSLTVRRNDGSRTSLGSS